jgi:hypothetical protein
MPEFTEQEKLEVIEALVEQWRPARSSSILGERETYLILKAIAKDIRGRLPGSPSRARDRLIRAIELAKANKTSSGYSIPDLRRIAEISIGEAAAITQALEHFEQREEANGS